MSSFIRVSDPNGTTSSPRPKSQERVVSSLAVVAKKLAEENSGASGSGAAGTSGAAGAGPGADAKAVVVAPKADGAVTSVAAAALQQSAAADGAASDFESDSGDDDGLRPKRGAASRKGKERASVTAPARYPTGKQLAATRLDRAVEVSPRRRAAGEAEAEREQGEVDYDAMAELGAAFRLGKPQSTTGLSSLPFPAPSYFISAALAAPLLKAARSLGYPVSLSRLSVASSFPCPLQACGSPRLSRWTWCRTTS